MFACVIRKKKLKQKKIQKFNTLSLHKNKKKKISNKTIENEKKKQKEHANKKQKQIVNHARTEIKQKANKT